MNEQWEWVPGYEGYYQVSNMGRVKSVGRIVYDKSGRTRKLKGRILKPRTQRNGYKLAVLSRDNKIENMLVHRLVATVFIGKHSQEMQYVNHKNFNRADNRAQNLEWCTQKENIQHARINGRFPKDKRCKAVVCSNGETYESIGSAAKTLGINRANLQMVLKGQRKHVSGLEFRFAE